MAAKRGKTQARRNTGNSGGMPGWAWLLLGIVLTVAVVLAAQRFTKPGGGNDFFRPKPNPDAKPERTSDDDAVAGTGDALPAPAVTSDARPKPTQYDFYKMLPGDEVQMSDAEIAATEREEAARKVATPSPKESAVPATPTQQAPASATPQQATATAPANGAADAPYLLQAGAFGASGDAEATKAKVALLGLSARVESAQISGKTVYRVRMGPYASASALAEAKRKLADGGLPAMAIKVK